MIKVTLGNGEIKEFDAPLSAFDAARELGEAKTACAAEIDGKVCDLRTTLTDGCTVKFLTFEDEQGQRAFNHTASHVLAQAVKRLFPATKLAIGPAIENGFYYDFDTEEPFTTDTLAKIEAEMKKIVKESIRLEHFTMAPDEAIKYLEEQGEPYKVELCQEHAGKGEPISFYKQGDFTDLCAGPHLMSTSPVKAFKLTSVTGAYWRGSEKNKMLTRIYATAFAKKEDLDAYVTMMEEAKKRDHRKLGKELGLFMMNDAGPGFPFFLPKGMVLKNTLLDYWREIHKKAGYVEISTPIILNRSLWETSGHWDHYKNNMYTTVIDGEDYAIKPMNCPGGVLVYASEPRSYRDLPLRYFEFGTVYRHEMSGVVHGLLRARGFTQDDGHIFCTEDQILAECEAFTALVQKVYKTFGFTDIAYKVATRPAMRIGEDAVWDKAEHALMASLDALGIKYEVLVGEGAFYGPKIEYHLKDCLGRSWQCGTVQVDFQMPGRLGAEYVAEDNSRKIPVMLHRAILGSLERWIGMLIEEFAGAFPVWLAPIQCAVTSITDNQGAYAKDVAAKLHAAGLRVQTDLRSEKINYKIRELSLQKLPYILVVGEKEAQTGTVSVRARGGENLGVMSLDAFIERISTENRERTR